MSGRHSGSCTKRSHWLTKGVIPLANDFNTFSGCCLFSLSDYVCRAFSIPFVCDRDLWVPICSKKGETVSILIKAGRPGFGKTYTATDEIIERLERGERVFSNFPVITPDKKYTSVVWEPWMTHEYILDAWVYIDEAYTAFDSTERDSVDQETHTFFATNRHNDVNAVLIAQNVIRIAKKIREIATYEYVEKRDVPFPLWYPFSRIYRYLMKKGYNPLGYERPPHLGRPRPLWFTIYSFDSEEKAQRGDKKDAAFVTRRIFKMRTAQSYDTHYFRRDNESPYESVTWIKHLDEKVPVPHRKLGNPYMQMQDLRSEAK